MPAAVRLSLRRWVRSRRWDTCGLLEPVGPFYARLQPCNGALGHRDNATAVPRYPPCKQVSSAGLASRYAPWLSWRLRTHGPGSGGQVGFGRSAWWSWDAEGFWMDYRRYHIFSIQDPPNVNRLSPLRHAKIGLHRLHEVMRDNPLAL